MLCSKYNGLYKNKDYNDFLNLYNHSLNKKKFYLYLIGFLKKINYKYWNFF